METLVAYTLLGLAVAGLAAEIFLIAYIAWEELVGRPYIFGGVDRKEPGED